MTPVVWFEAGMQTGEGPVWDDRLNCLWCVDSTNPAVWQFDAKGRPLDRIALPQAVGFVCLTDRDGHLLIGLEDGVYVLRQDLRRLERLFDPEPGLDGNRINDATIDVDGALVFGTLHKLYREPTGAMYRYSVEGKLQQFDRGYIVSNGPCAHPDGRLLVANSEVYEVYAFDRTAEGDFANRRLFCDWDLAWGIPDGIVCDAEGGVWIACWDGGAVLRFDADGLLTHRVTLPVSRVTKAAFGGPTFSQLFITTANREIPSRREPLAGSVFIVETEVVGLPARRLTLP